jgi:1,4-alpha-glucan branching enzyme
MKKGHAELSTIAALIILTLLGCSSAGDRVTSDLMGPEIVEGGAIFRYQDTDAKRVYLVGDFNNWSPRSDPMKDPNGDGNWSLFFPLKPGTYSYKFVVDGRWVPDPHNPVDEPDGFGGLNSVVKVPVRNPVGESG